MAVLQGADWDEDVLYVMEEEGAVVAGSGG